MDNECYALLIQGRNRGSHLWAGCSWILYKDTYTVPQVNRYALWYAEEAEPLKNHETLKVINNNMGEVE